MSYPSSIGRAGAPARKAIRRSDVRRDALSRVEGWKETNILRKFMLLDGRERLDAYPFYWAALGDLALRQGERTSAAEWLTRGLACARTETEREMFLRRIGECGRRGEQR